MSIPNQTASLEGGTANLQRLVWLGLQWDVRKDGVLPDLGSFMEVTFDRLAVSSRRLDNTSVDNLCIMDLEVHFPKCKLLNCVHACGIN